MKQLLLCFFCLIGHSLLYGVSREDVTPQLLQDIFQQYYAEDPDLQAYVKNFPFENYDIYYVENRDIYYVDNVPDLIKDQFIRRGIFWECHVFAQLWKYTKPNTVAIDIGGHIGTHTLSLSRFVRNGTVYVFEPQLKLFVELVINMHLNKVHNVVFHRMALGNEVKWVEMFPYNPHNEGGRGIGPGGERVKMQQLDSFALKNVSMIKVDVEGLEMEVIEGGKETILQNRPVMVVEIMGGVMYKNATQEQREEIHRRMAKIEELGYQVRPLGLHDYLCIPKNTRLNWFK